MATTTTMIDETLVRREATEEETTTRGHDRMENGIFNKMARVIWNATTTVPSTRESTKNPRRCQESHPPLANTKIM
jgi:hypothetical protein